MKIKIKKLHPDAVIPSYAKDGDAGMDLTAVSVKWNYGLGTYDTGLSIEIPKGYVGYLFPRSSIYKTGLSLSNCVGVIDSGYRGPIMLKYIKTRMGDEYNKGDRIGQLVIMPIPTIEFEEVAELSETERSDGGFGSSGR